MKEKISNLTSGKFFFLIIWIFFFHMYKWISIPTAAPLVKSLCHSKLDLCHQEVRLSSLLEWPHPDAAPI